MQLFKHMEVVLMLAFGIVCATVAMRPATSQVESVARDAIPTVHVVGHRMTAEEKRASAN